MQTLNLAVSMLCGAPREPEQSPGLWRDTALAPMSNLPMSLWRLAGAWSCTNAGRLAGRGSMQDRGALTLPGLGHSTGGSLLLQHPRAPQSHPLPEPADPPGPVVKRMSTAGAVTRRITAAAEAGERQRAMNRVWT
jgi:hypothetical protein